MSNTTVTFAMNEIEREREVEKVNRYKAVLSNLIARAEANEQEITFRQKEMGVLEQALKSLKETGTCSRKAFPGSMFANQIGNEQRTYRVDELSDIIVD